MACVSRKNDGLGMYIPSDFDAFPSFPRCISRPRRLNESLITSSPRVMSSRDPKMNAPSSTKRTWMT